MNQFCCGLHVEFSSWFWSLKRNLVKLVGIVYGCFQLMKNRPCRPALTLPPKIVVPTVLICTIDFTHVLIMVFQKWWRWNIPHPLPYFLFSQLDLFAGHLQYIEVCQSRQESKLVYCQTKTLQGGCHSSPVTCSPLGFRFGWKD